MSVIVNGTQVANIIGSSSPISSIIVRDVVNNRIRVVWPESVPFTINFKNSSWASANSPAYRLRRVISVNGKQIIDIPANSNYIDNNIALPSGVYSFPATLTMRTYRSNGTYYDYTAPFTLSAGTNNLKIIEEAKTANVIQGSQFLSTKQRPYKLKIITNSDFWFYIDSNDYDAFPLVESYAYTSSPFLYTMAVTQTLSAFKNGGTPVIVTNTESHSSENYGWKEWLDGGDQRFVTDLANGIRVYAGHTYAETGYITHVAEWVAPRERITRGRIYSQDDGHVIAEYTGTSNPLALTSYEYTHITMEKA